MKSFKLVLCLFSVFFLLNSSVYAQKKDTTIVLPSTVEELTCPLNIPDRISNLIIVCNNSLKTVFFEGTLTAWDGTLHTPVVIRGEKHTVVTSKPSRVIDNGKSPYVALVMKTAEPPMLDNYYYVNWSGYNIQYVLTNPERIALIVPQQYIDRYKKSSQWKGTLVFSSIEDFKSFRKDDEERYEKERFEKELKQRLELEAQIRKEQEETAKREAEERAEKERIEALTNTIVGTWKAKSWWKHGDIKVVIDKEHLLVESGGSTVYDGTVDITVSRDQISFYPYSWSWQEKEATPYLRTQSYITVSYYCRLILKEDNTLWIRRETRGKGKSKEEEIQLFREGDKK